MAALALGAFSVIGFAPLAVSPAPTFSLAGLFLLWHRAPSARHAAAVGLAWGLGCFGIGVSWIYVSLSQFSGLAAPLAGIATIVFCLYLALYPALAGAFFFRLQSRDNTPTTRDALLFAAIWVLAEWLRGTLFTGFPWLAIGYSQSPPSPMAGYAAVLGVYGVGGLVALVAALLALVTTSVWRSSRQWQLVASVIAILTCGELLLRMDWTAPVGKPLSVSLLQGNVAQGTKWDPQRVVDSIDRYVALSTAQGSSLTVLPETALPTFFSEVPRDILRALTRHGDALIGVAIETRDGGYANGAVAVSPQLTVQAYAKRHLVPFGEYPPPGFDWFLKLLRIPMSGFTPGAAQQAPLRIADQKIMPNICYEDLFGEELLAALHGENGATILLNMSNTAWFGDSLAQPQHLQIAQIRALETGRVMLRATNTGMTAMVLPNGKVAAQLPPFTSGALKVEAQGYSGLTPYAKWGNALALVLAVAAIIAGKRKGRPALAVPPAPTF